MALRLFPAAGLLGFIAGVAVVSVVAWVFRSRIRDSGTTRGGGGVGAVPAVNVAEQV